MTYYEKAMIKKHQRELEVKRNIILLLASITIVLLLALFAKSTLSTVASDDSHRVSYKYFKSIMIEKGDTLWSIAEENIDYTQYKNVNEYIKEIRQMNSLKSDSIKAGNYIIIPYYSYDFVQSL